MVTHEASIRDDPRTGRVSALLHALSQRTALLTTDQQRFGAIADALAEIVPFDRLTIAVVPCENEPAIPVFRRASPADGPLLNDGAGSALPAGVPRMSVNAVLDSDAMTREGFRQVITCPVLIGGRPCGLVQLATREAQRFSESDLWIVETIANTATLTQALARSRTADGNRERLTVDELMLELAELIASRPTTEAVMERIAERVAASGDCDVVVMSRQASGWIGGPPAVRDSSRLRSRRLLLDRLRTLQPPVQRRSNHTERGGAGTSDATAELAELVGRIDELLNSLPGQMPDLDEMGSSMVCSVPPELGGPLVLVALRSEPGDHPFTDDDRAGIWRLLRALSLALLTATLEESLTRADGERDAIHRMVTTIGTGRTMLDRLKIACRTAQLLLACDYVAITNWDTDPPTVRVAIGQIASESVTLSRKGTITDVRRHEGPRIINAFPSDPPLDAASYPLHIAEGLSASLTFRLQWSGRIFGSLVLGYRRPRLFPVGDLLFAESMAQMVVASLGPELSRHEHP